MTKRLLALAFLLVLSTAGFSQELVCTVKILDNQIQLTNKKIFRTLEQVLTEYMNTTKWTDLKVMPEERIECNLQIVLSSYDVTRNSFSGTLQVQSTRPVYGTSYNTVVFNFLDENINFEYAEFQRMNFNQNAFSDNLTSLFAFYAYYILGLDQDSFGMLGGTPYFQKALQIANNAQPTGIAGWQPFERNLRSRYNLIDNILNERFRPIREAYYKYHRQGLDVMSKTPEIARKNIFESLQLVQKIFKVAPNTVMLIVFFEAKSDELVNIYKNAPPIEKPKAIELLSEINIANISKYEKIR
jgi:GTPase SAR1 family protein